MNHPVTGHRLRIHLPPGFFDGPPPRRVLAELVHLPLAGRTTSGLMVTRLDWVPVDPSGKMTPAATR